MGTEVGGTEQDCRHDKDGSRDKECDHNRDRDDGMCIENNHEH